MVHSKKVSQDLLQELIDENYGLKLVNFANVRAAIKIKTDQGNFGFVQASSNKKLDALAAFLNYLIKNDFKQIANLYPTKEGNYSVSIGEEKVKLIDWIDGKECNLNNPKILSKTATTYARFHKSSKGFTPPPKSKWTSNLGKWPENMKNHYNFILEAKKNCQNVGDRSIFEKKFLSTVDHFLKDMQTAMNLLAKSDYSSLVKKALKEPCTIHHSCYYQNLIHGNDDLIYLIDYGKLMIDLPIHDIANFMIRHIRHKHWNFELAKIIIDSYQKERKLNNSEFELLKILTLYPIRYYKIVEKYVKKEKPDDYLTKHLVHLISEIPLRHKFIEKYTRTYLK